MVEYIKKPISEYDFIVDGYQTYHTVKNDFDTINDQASFDESEEVMDKFIVQRCRCHRRDRDSMDMYVIPKILRKDK